jgi:hypothetical protein
MSVANTKIPKIILDNCAVFSEGDFKSIKPTYRNVQNIIRAYGIRIEISSIKKLFDRIETFLNRENFINEIMVQHHTVFPELKTMTLREREELMCLVIYMFFKPIVILWLASDIGRDKSRYDPRSIKTFEEEVLEIYVKSLV